MDSGTSRARDTAVVGQPVELRGFAQPNTTNNFMSHRVTSFAEGYMRTGTQHRTRTAKRAEIYRF